MRPDARILNASPYMRGMNRRTFIQSLVAVFAFPATPTLSLGPATAALPTAAVVPAHARSWAIYMSTLHGECTPQALQNLLNISAVDARKYIIQLIAEGTIKPIPLLQKSLSNFTKTNDGNILDELKKRLEMKAQAESEREGVRESIDENECLGTNAELLADFPETDPEVFIDGKSPELKTQNSIDSFRTGV